MRIFLRASALSVCVLLLAAAPNAFAVNKDIIALQAQVQQLQDMMMSMQQANDERYATMHNLLQQTSESVTKVASQVESMQKAAQDQQGAQGNSLQQLSGQMQSMNDSLDELRARLDKLDKELSSISSQQSSLAAGQTLPTGQSGQPMPANGQPTGDQPQAATDQPPAPQAPPLDQLYQSAASDYNAAKYNLSSQLSSIWAKSTIAPEITRAPSITTLRFFRSTPAVPRLPQRSCAKHNRSWPWVSATPAFTICAL